MRSPSTLSSHASVIGQLLLRGRHGQCLQRVEQAPRIAVGVRHQALNRFIFDSWKCAFWHWLLPQFASNRSVKRLQHIHRRTRQQGRVDFERRVLGGGADEGEQAAFDMRQKGVLLALVEAVHLVDKHDGAPHQAVRATWACSTASRMSFTPPRTALMVMNCASNASAMSRAMVVLPTPGGPHKMQLCGWPDSNARRKAIGGVDGTRTRDPRRDRPVF
jgi:hypothetical protein